MATFVPVNIIASVFVRRDLALLINAFGGTLADLNDTIGDSFSGGLLGDQFVAGNANDTLNGSLGSDLMGGGGGDDLFSYTSALDAPGDTIDGGAGADELRTGAGVASYDFTGTTFDGTSGAAIEVLNIFNSTTQNLIFNASQFGGAGIATTLLVIGDVNGTETVTINNASNFSAAGFTFSSWTNATDRIVINGTTSFDFITGSSQRDTISGGLGADVINGSAGADRHEGGGGSDVIAYASQAHIDNDTIDGGADVDELRTGNGVASYDFTTATFAGSSGAAIERLNIFNSTTQNVIFNASQFGGAGIANNLVVVGDSGTETVTINNASNFSAAGFTFPSWSSSDRILINGTGGGDFIAGSSQRDTISGGLGADAIDGSAGADLHEGGGGNDVLRYASQAQIDNDTIDGGADVDQLRTSDGVASYDFTTATFAGSSGAAIEQLSIRNTTTQNVIFNASQFGGAGIATTLLVIGDGGAETVTINNATNFSAASFTFSFWTTATDRIVINGTGNADSITGSSQRDTISGGLGVDLIIGSAGADRHEGGGGNDVLRYASQAEIDNDTIDGGADVDELTTSFGVVSYDFTTATFAGTSGAAIDQLNISNFTTQNVIFNASQFGGAGIAATLAILGNVGTETVTINNASNFSAAGFSFEFWDAATDRFVINGTTSFDIITGSSQRDTISGGLGADLIIGSAGADRHEGGGGNDVIEYAGQAQIDNDTIDGGADVDLLRTTAGVGTYDFTTATFAGSSGAAIDRLFFVNLTAQTVIFNAGQFGGAGIAMNLDVLGNGGTETVTINNATNFSAAGFTFLFWDTATDRIVINGTGGADDITGSSQRDTISGGLGADLIRGSAGADRHEGGGGNDVLRYESQAETDGDTIDGGADIDDLQTNFGVGTYDFTTATFAGSSGAAIERLDILNSTTQNVIFNASQFGGAGIATSLIVIGDDGTETVTINNASNFSAAGLTFSRWTTATDRIVINGTGGADTITGSSESDLITGGIGADTLTGGNSDDTLDGGAGADVLDGGAGTADWASYFNAGGAVALYIDSPAANTGDAAGDTFASMEFFELTNGFADTFFGGSSADFAFGQGGADVLFGNAGNDALYGQAGDDFLLGGNGADVLDGGTAGFDAVYYGDSATAVSINLSTGTHTGFAAGDSFVGIEGYLLTEAGDTMTGLDSPSLGEVIYGLGGDDRLVGLGGFDWLLGGEGADTLVGGFGFDLLIGGGGADRFVYETGGEGGVGEGIADFQVGIDKLAFVTASTGITGLTLGQNLFIQNSTVTTITGSQGTGTGPTLIYDTSNGALWYDTNGNLADGLIYLVGLSGAPLLTAGDFMVI